MKKIVDIVLACGYVGYMNLINKIKRLFNQILAHFPTQLPAGLPQFEAWAKSIRDNHDLPTQHVDSINFVLTNEIMHLDISKPNYVWGPIQLYWPHRKSKMFFVRRLKVMGAKQIAGTAFREIKERADAIIAAEQAAAQAAQVSAASSLSEVTSQVVPISES